MKKTNNTFLKIAILAIALVSQINTITSVLIPFIAEHYPQASDVAVKYVMQMGMIGAFPISLGVGFFLKKFRIKPMLLTGLILIIAGGILPIFYHDSINMLHIWAAMVGVGQGFMAPLLATLILQSFEGKEKDSMLGLNTTFSTGGSTLLVLIAGYVCAFGWLKTYYIYLLVLPILLIALFLLPMGEKPVPSERNSGNASKVPVPFKGWIQCALVVLMFVSYVSFPLNCANLIFSEKLGDTNSIAMAISIVTVVGAIVGLIFTPVIKVVKLYIGSFAAIFGFLGMFFASTASSIGMVYLAAAMLGLFFGASLSGGSYVVGNICTPEQIGPTMSISMSCMTLGIILSPNIEKFLTGLWGGAGPKDAFKTSAALFAVAFVLQVLWGSYLTKTSNTKNQQSL